MRRWLAALDPAYLAHGLGSDAAVDTSEGAGTDAWGVDDGWRDTQDRWHPTPPAAIDAMRAAMGDPADRPVWAVRPGAADPLRGRCHLTLEDGTDVGEVDALPGDLPLGIHELRPLDGGPVTTLLAGPGRCHLPDGLREWGIAVQVPTARSRGSWGIGDLADVRALGEWVTSLGGHALGLSPLHAPTPVAPLPTSPYSPSSRRWRSPLLVRVDEVAPEDPEVARLGAEARRLLDLPVVRRDEAWRHQRAALEHVWSGLPDRAREEAARWRAAQGDELEEWATYCTLAEEHGAGWRTWPEALRRPHSAAVAAAVRERTERIAFHAWLQQLVDQQLARASASGVRLVQDLAIGVDPDGADGWIWQDLFAEGYSVGAPPDDFQPEGQSWGLPPWIPWRLRDAGYRPLAARLRAAMAEGGGLRIDHVMGLTRLFWVRDDGHPADGAYVRFARGELLELVALESARAGAIVVGEDLGTVEPGLRQELSERRILSTKVVWFEDEAPERWPEQALAMVTTHDLPTLAGMCSGADAPSAMREHLEVLVGPVEGRPVDEVAVEVHGHLGASPSVAAFATLEDLLLVPERPNAPGTTDADRPNWSQALPVLVDDLPEHPAALATLAALASRRRD